MKTLIKTLKSRYGDLRHIYQLSPNLYLIEGPSHYLRSAEDMIDFEGGPYIDTDSNIIEGQKIIKFTSVDAPKENWASIEITTATSQKD